MGPPIEETVVISAAPTAVWDALTKPDQMVKWQAEPSMELIIEADWTIGGTVSLRGFHVVTFDARGKTLVFDPPRQLAYTQLSSISRLPDVPESYNRLQFTLVPVAAGTSLTVHITGFPTETIQKHLAFYWRGTLNILKRFVEGYLASPG